MSSQVCGVVTYNARSASSLLRLLQTRHGPSSSNRILLFALAPSPTTPPEVLSDITSTLTKLHPEHVGCISAPPPSQLSIRSGPHSCSLAYALVNGVSFRSTISGRTEAQVGRWHAARQGDMKDANGGLRVNEMQIAEEFSEYGKVDWESIWDRTRSSVVSPSNRGNGEDIEMLPYALRNLDPAAIQNILYFSDKAPEGLAAVLGAAFPQANKLSLIASSTPFITGRPVTLFHNGSIMSNGAVGIVFTSSHHSSSPVVELSFPPLVPLSANLIVSSSEGNLILSLDSQNPTQLLLSAIQKHGLASLHAMWVGKEDEFYVGVMEAARQQTVQPIQLHRINAGDPSRGAIALDSPFAPCEGSIVRLYHLPKSAETQMSKYFPSINNVRSISLFATSDMTAATGLEDEKIVDDDSSVVLDAFLAASENGFTLSRGAQGFWKCVVPGARTGLSWR